MHYHFIGIGGIGMSAIARLYMLKGYRVSGSDAKESIITRDLAGYGAEIFYSHQAENLKGADIIVYSSAIKKDNPELMQAKKLGIPVIKRAQALAELMKDKTVVTVTGSHGKTTTSSLAYGLLHGSGLSPSAAIGGILMKTGTNFLSGDGEFFIAEADESDGSFLYYRPKYSIITNIDYEHMDYYKEFKNVLSAYGDFIASTAKDGCLFYCLDDKNLSALIKSCDRRCISFGLDDRADIYAKNIKLEKFSSHFECYFKKKHIERYFLPLCGTHNISNALSVIALGLELGIDHARIKDVLAAIKGIKRRQEVKFQDDRYLLVDDYAHHPTEIIATLKAVRNLNPKRIIVVFQPHRYSRTKSLLDEFAGSFHQADHLVLTDIYPAAEEPLEGVNTELLSRRIKDTSFDRPVECVAREGLVSHILRILRSGDLVITLGAGDITRVSDELAEELRKKI